MSGLKSFIRSVAPPFLWDWMKSLRTVPPARINPPNRLKDPVKQDLDLYWDPNYTKILEEWGKDNTWIEIQMLLAGARGTVLDIACGTGITIKLLEKYPDLVVHGFDISDLLIASALNKGIPAERLKVQDATSTGYRQGEFDYSYSIGSLEHFTAEGIDRFIAETARFTRIASFHMVPVSRSGKDEGWMKTMQSFFNNSEGWWLQKFRKHYARVEMLSSRWSDEISLGRWYLCYP